MNEQTTELVKSKIIDVPSDERTNVEIIPFGSDERIRLNVSIIQKLIAVPTRTGKLPDQSQCMKFIMLCKARHLNPFEGDAYLIGYDTQNGPQFSLITAHQVFLKRAEASEGFDGLSSGVIVKSNTNIEEREGDIVYENEELLGGWAKAHRKDRQFPFYRRLKLATFNTGKSRWEKDPAGMIVKCAEADALRSAFPTHLGGLYVAEERPPIDITPTPIERPIIAKPKGRPKKEKVKLEKKKELGPFEENFPAAAPTNAELIEKKLAESGHTVTQLLEVAAANEWIDAPATGPLSEIPLTAVGEEKLAQFLEFWDDVVVDQLPK